jgi:ATP-dependent Zn protease
MERDNMSQEEAEDLLNEAKEEAQNVLEEDGGLEDIEDILLDYFGLEPDYIFDLIDL